MITVRNDQCEIESAGMPDCGCPWEHWHIGLAGTCLSWHLEPDMSLDLFLDAGDWERQVTVRGIGSVEQAREEAFAWGAKLVGEKYEYKIQG